MGVPSRRWTEEEDRILRQAYEEKTSLINLPEKLNRSRAAICIRANRMGLDSPLYSSEYILKYQFIKILCGRKNMDGTYIRKLFNRWTAAGLKLKKVKLTTTPHYLVDINEFWRWAEKHQEMVNLRNLEPNALGPEPEWVKQKRERDFDAQNTRQYLPWTEAEYKSMLYYLTEEKLRGADLERKTGRSIHSINYILTKKGNKLRAGNTGNGKNRWTKDEESMLVAAVLAGHDILYIADQLNRSVLSVRHHLGYHYKTENLENLRQLLKEKENNREILQSRTRMTNMAALVKSCAKRIARRKAK